MTAKNIFCSLADSVSLVYVTGTSVSKWFKMGDQNQQPRRRPYYKLIAMKPPSVGWLDLLKMSLPHTTTDDFVSRTGCQPNLTPMQSNLLRFAYLRRHSPGSGCAGIHGCNRVPNCRDPGPGRSRWSSSPGSSVGGRRLSVR